MYIHDPLPAAVRSSSCVFRFVPGCRFMVQSDGATMVKVIVQLQPEPVAVMVTLPALSSAVNRTFAWLPEFGVSVPLPLVIAQVAGAGFTVRSTSSPTPIRVLVRSAGEVATVCDVIVQCVGQGGEPPSAAPPPAVLLGPLFGPVGATGGLEPWQHISYPSVLPAKMCFR